MTQATIGEAKADTGGERSLADAPCFIELQFPVSKVSKESYNERKGHQGQTLTGLGKWWGRKPLVLCRAIMLGILLPATDDPKGDRDTFLSLMTMDAAGLAARRKPVPPKEVFRRLPPSGRKEYFVAGSTEERARYLPKLRREEKEVLQSLAYASMTYDQKLDYAFRPEEIEGPSSASWDQINTHLGTSAKNLPSLVAELGVKRFGRTPRVGDAFCGGGSVPFEAARIGCDSFGSDLSPVAALLSWGALNVIGGDDDVARDVRAAQRAVYDIVDKQLAEWGIEQDGERWRADAYLYCAETRCPECGWIVPLSPSWMVGLGSRTIAVLRGNAPLRRFIIDVRSGVTLDELSAAKAHGTVKDSELICPHCTRRTPVSALRRDGLGGKDFGLRMWEAHDLVPRDDDVFGERLYCIRWMRTVTTLDETGRERQRTECEFRSVTAGDIQREQRALELLRPRFDEWQRRGFIPSRRIERGEKTTEPIRTRGWTHWHHLFTPRQLLQHGLLAEAAHNHDSTLEQRVLNLLAIGRCANWNSRLCQWGTGQARESIAQTFYNQALNAFYNYAGKSLRLLEGAWFVDFKSGAVRGNSTIQAEDARCLVERADVWITDPPYGDAINYHELSEFFLAWYGPQIQQLFPNWKDDSRRALAVSGASRDFSKAMVQCYRRLASSMPGNGIQVVMFTHQDSAVWADLALILWAAGLRVTAAWCVATETDAAGLKEGNYVQGTVILVLRKKSETAQEVFLADVYQMVEAEVRRQLDAMLALDDQEDPNFTDNDYRLAAYAAALRVLTQSPIAEIDVEHELSKERARGEESAIAGLIDNAVKIACDHLVPRGVDRDLWRELTKTERIYLAGLEQESHGEHRNGVYQELARGFGVKEYQFLLASSKANETRLKTSKELARKDLEGSGRLAGLNSDGGTIGDRKEFARSLLRQALFATFKTAETEETSAGMAWLRTEVGDYWNQRERLVQLLDYIAALGQNASMPHWHMDAESARKLAGAVRNDHV